MLRRITFPAILIVVLVGSSILGACTPTPTTAPAKIPSTPPTAPAPEGPIRGGVLRSAILEEAPTYDPYTSTTNRIIVHAATVWNALVRCDPLKAEVRVENMIPDLAEKWEMSPDGKTYTFYLRQGVKFHDGHPFTAEDVKYSLDKFRDPKSSALASNVEAVDNIQIVNDFTVKINLKYSYPELLLFLCSPYACILPAHLKTVDPKSTDFLVGTGPFRFQSRVPGKVYIYERNTDYFQKGLPYLDRYEVYVLSTSALMADQFIGGRLDTSGTLRQFLEDNVKIQRVKEQAPEALRQTAPNGSTRGMQFNLARKGPWQDARVRKAMAMVLDYEGCIVATVGSLEVGFVAPAGIVPFYMKEALSQKEVMTILGLDKPPAERVATAKQLMKDAGYADGFSATCIGRDNEISYIPMLFAADLWKRHLNIDLKAENMAISQLFPRRDSGEFDIYFGDFTSSTGSSVIEFLGFFTSTSFINAGKWSNAEYDKLFSQVVNEMDSSKRMEAARRAQQIFLNDLAYLPFHATVYGIGVRPDIRIGWPPVKGVVLQPTQTNLTSIDYVWFARTPDAKRWMETQK